MLLFNVYFAMYLCHKGRLKNVVYIWMMMFAIVLAPEGINSIVLDQALKVFNHLH